MFRVFWVLKLSKTLPKLSQLLPNLPQLVWKLSKPIQICNKNCKQLSNSIPIFLYFRSFASFLQVFGKIFLVYLGFSSLVRCSLYWFFTQIEVFEVLNFYKILQNFKNFSTGVFIDRKRSIYVFMFLKRNLHGIARNCPELHGNRNILYSFTRSLNSFKEMEDFVFHCRVYEESHGTARNPHA